MTENGIRLEVGKPDLDLLKGLSNTNLTSQEVADAILKSNSIKSSAKKIDQSLSRNRSAVSAIQLAAERRVDIVMMGDSNQLKDGFGFAGAFVKSFGEKYGLYATGIGASITTGSERHFNIISGAASSGAPSEIENIWPSNSPEQYSYVADGATSIPSQSGVSITINSLLDTKKELKFWTCWGSFTTGAGKFRRMVRYGASPYTTIVQESVQTNTNIGEAKKNFSALTIPADQNRLQQTIECKVGNVSAWTITGPFVEFYSRVERPDLESGISVHTLYGVGEMSLYDMALTLNGYSDLALKNFFEETRRLQLEKYQQPIVVVYINSGLNDLNETEVSLGKLKSPVDNSKEAYFDNLNSIIDRIEKIWKDNWDINELYFLLVPSHPTGNATEDTLDLYRKKCNETMITRDRCSYINLRNLITSDEILNNGYYLNGGADRYHLNSPGYIDISNRIVNEIDE